MKKFKLILFTIASIILFNTSVNADWWGEIGSGGGYAGDGNGLCTSTQGCYCRWNGANYGALKITIIYYDGFTRSRLGIPVIYYNSPHGDYGHWINKRLPAGAAQHSYYKSWLPYTHSNAASGEVLNISNDIEESLIGSSQVNAVYPHIKEIFKDTHVSYEGLLAAVSSNGTYKDGVNNREYHNMVNEKIGSKGQGTKGIRIIVEPLVTVRSAAVCYEHPTVVDRMFTVKNLFQTYYGDTSGSNGGYKEVVPDYTLDDYSKLLYLEKGDAGYAFADYNKYKNNKNHLSSVGSEESGWGLNIYGPFDKMVTNICDPDQEYEGYKSGVQYCCKKFNITPTDKSKNTKKNMKRILTDAEINADCSKQKCDPKIDGVDKCCVDCDVTLGNLENNKESDCMTGPIDLKDLENSSCNKNSGKDCEYSLESSMPKNCDNDNVGHVKDIASWSCVFNSSNKNSVKNHYIQPVKNSYCAIYCKETIDIVLPEPGTVGKAGRFLILGDVDKGVPAIVDKIKPIRYSGSKTCRVTAAEGSNIGTINKSKFEHDMVKIEDEISASWDAWKISQAQLKACIYGSGSYNNVKYTCPKNPDGTKKNTSAKVAAAEKRYQNAIKKREEHINQINACTKYASNNEVELNPTVKFEYSEPTYGYLSNGNKKSWTLKQENVKKELEYKFTKNGNSNYNMGYSTREPEMISKSMYNCSGSVPCKKTSTYEYPNVAWWESVSKKEVNFELPDHTYQFISKSTARSFDSKEAAGGNNAIDMVVPNLPIHISTEPGYYDYRFTTESFGSKNKFNKYIINGNAFNGVDYDKLNNYSCKFRVDCEDPLIIPDVEEYCEKCETSDICTETPKCDPKDPDCDKGTCGPEDPNYPTCIDEPCDPDDPDCDKGGCNPGDPDCDKGGNNPLGVDLIFRTVSLNSEQEAFPGANGEGRPAGDNWKDNVDKYIVNNRGFKGYEVYKNSPLYEIVLTPALMKEIREYNKEQNGKIITIYDGASSSTGIAGYGDYDSMVCKDNGQYCISTKIRDWNVTGCGVDGYDKGKFNKCTPPGGVLNPDILIGRPWRHDDYIAR